MPRTDGRIELLLEILDQAFDRQGWHGTTLRGSVRKLDSSAALWRPAPGRHNIWELVLHTAYWKYAVRRRLRGATGRFPRKPSNWPAAPAAPDERAWAEDVALLDQEHALLRAAVAGFPASRLGAHSSKGARWTNAEEIHGVAAHDLYHTGQIQLVRRLQG